MNIPKLQQSAQTQQTVSVFGGYDHNLQIPDGFFYDMKNMTSDYFPVLASREKRGFIKYSRPVRSIVSSHGLCYVCDGDFILPGSLGVEMGLTPGGKQLITLGAYVIILPDKKWINVAAALEGDASEPLCGTLDNQWESGDASVELRACRPDGTEPDSWQVATQKPAEPQEGQLWWDDTVWPGELKRWSQTLEMWITEDNCCIKLISPGIGEGFFAGDTVQLETQESQLPEKGHILVVEQDHLVIRGCVRTSPRTLTGENALIISRKMPEMDLVFACGNRLWGCKYGIADGQFYNEIYCSKLGDFRNWNSFEGISTDSFTASIGEDGPFTGGIAYMGRPLFFKEHCMIEVYGNYPANYQVHTTPCDGVQRNSQNSLAIVNNVLYYKSCQGVCAYDGSMPVQKGNVFGTETYCLASAGSYGNKYYVSMYGDEGWNLFVYDTLRDLWHREDAVCIIDFIVVGENFYGLDGETGLIWNLSKCDSWNPPVVDWMVETGPLGLTEPETRYVSRISLRLWLETDANATVSCRYDNEPQWIHLATLTGTELGSVTVPIRPRRCDHMRLKLEGTGGVRIYSITKVWEKGSDL